MPLDPQAKVLIDLIEGTGDFALTHGFVSMIDWVEAGKVAFDDAVAAVRAAFGRA